MLLEDFYFQVPQFTKVVTQDEYQTEVVTEPSIDHAYPVQSSDETPQPKVGH